MILGHLHPGTAPMFHAPAGTTWAATKAERYADVMAQVLLSSRVGPSSTLLPGREIAPGLAPDEVPAAAAAGAALGLDNADDDPLGHGGGLDAPE